MYILNKLMNIMDNLDNLSESNKKDLSSILYYNIGITCGESNMDSKNSRIFEKEIKGALKNE